MERTALACRLNARVRSVLRRKQFGGSTALIAANLELHPEDRAVTVNGLPLVLNRKEFERLNAMVIIAKEAGLPLRMRAR